MRVNGLNLVGAFVIALLMLHPLDSQSSPKDASSNDDETFMWANFGGGGARVYGGLGEDDGGLSAGVTLSYCKGKHLLSIRQISNVEFQLDIFGNSGPPEGVWDLGILYGRILKGENGLASLSGGVGLVGSSANEITSYAFGIPLEGQLVWTPSQRFGLGLRGFADLNSEKSFVGALFCVQIGHLR